MLRASTRTYFTSNQDVMRQIEITKSGPQLPGKICQTESTLTSFIPARLPRCWVEA